MLLSGLAFIFQAERAVGVKLQRSNPATSARPVSRNFTRCANAIDGNGTHRLDVHQVLLHELEKGVDGVRCGTMRGEAVCGEHTSVATKINRGAVT